jgi:hypothetical protein
MVHAQPTSNPASPNPQQQTYQPPSAAGPVQSFQPGPQSGQAGWHAQYNAMQTQMGGMEIGSDGASPHSGQQHSHQPYQGVGAPA